MTINTTLTPPAPTTVEPIQEEPIASTKLAKAPTDLYPDLQNNVPDDVVLWRLSVAQYHKIAHAGILDEDDPVELLEGLLVYKMTKKPPYTVATGLTYDALSGLLPEQWFLSSQEPITLAESEPEPDLMVVRGERRSFLRRHPGAAEVGLVVEVADATLRRDRGTKKRIYARAGIPVYWVINLIDYRIEVYTNPTGPAKQPDYLTQQFFGLGDEASFILAGEEIAKLPVQALLPQE